MKLCVISNDPYPATNSSGMRTMQFIDYLAQFGHDVFLYHIDPGTVSINKPNSNIKIRDGLLSMYSGFIEKFDLILNMDPVLCNIPAPILSQFTRTKIISELQDPLEEWRVMKNPLLKKIFGYIYKKSDFITTTHNELKRQLTNNFSIQPDKIGVVYNGVDLDFYKPMNIAKEIDVLYTGSPFGFGKILEKVRNECKPRNINFLWTPKDKSVPFENMPELLNKSKICILPAEQGHWHNKLMEYLACGAAVVAIETEQTETVIKDGENGLLAKDGDDLIRKILLLLEDDFLRQKISCNARNSVLEYSWEKLSRKFEYFILQTTRY